MPRHIGFQTIGKCRICGIWCEDIPVHIRNSHGVSVEEYLKAFPECKTEKGGHLLYGKKLRGSKDDIEYMSYWYELQHRDWTDRDRRRFLTGRG